MAAQPVDAIVVGLALNDRGFEAFNTIAGLGLNTRGFLWPCDGIWQPSNQPITTIWTPTLPPNVTTEVCLDVDVAEN